MEMIRVQKFQNLIYLLTDGLNLMQFGINMEF